ncbi:hypothetical protein GF377_07720 [candidate division GN15 bacterium]|nr:hypothetical protein [candidate division GN15 bacterium]
MAKSVNPDISDPANGHRVDYGQVRTLVRFSIKRAWRGTTNPFMAMQHKTSRFPGMLAVLLLNGFFSILLVMAFDAADSLFGGLVLAGLGSMALVGLQVLLEYSHIIITPDDYDVISPHPVNSRTFYVAKLVHFMTFVAILSAATSLLPGIFASVFHRDIVALPLVLVHFLVSNTFAALLMISFFSLAIRVLKRRTMERVLGYIQVGFLLTMYLGYFVAASEIRNLLEGIDVRTIGWLKISPTYWFATPIKLLSEGWDGSDALLGAIGLAALVLLGTIVLSRLSLSYAESISKSDERMLSKPRRKIPIVSDLWRRFARPEDQAILALVRAQYKHDMRFRLNVIWILPYALLVRLYEWYRGQTQFDPFNIPTDSDIEAGFLLPMAIALLPFVLHAALRSSKSWQAAWVFHASSSDPLRLVLAAKRLITILFILPLCVYFFGIYAYLWGHPLHAFLHTVTVLVVSLNGLSLLNLLSAGLPFADENPYGQYSVALVSTIPIMILIGVPLMVISGLGYSGYLNWAVVVVIGFAFNWALTRFQNLRIRKQIRAWEFRA